MGDWAMEWVKRQEADWVRMAAKAEGEGEDLWGWQSSYAENLRMSEIKGKGGGERLATLVEGLGDEKKRVQENEKCYFSKRQGVGYAAANDTGGVSRTSNNGCSMICLANGKNHRVGREEIGNYVLIGWTFEWEQEMIEH
ncbi:hypothetical protein Ancab_029700 [Ancistrocladus abbreviatus]